MSADESTFINIAEAGVKILSALSEARLPLGLLIPSQNLLRSAILVLSNTTEMSSLGLFAEISDGNIMGYFGTILTRSWYMADDPPSYSDLGAQIEWLSLLLSDPNRVRAARLHAAYYQCRSQVTNDKSALETLEQQHYNLQCCVTPTHRLPAEIMMEIFRIAIDIGQLRSGLMHVCRRWCRIIEGMASIWAFLDLGAGLTSQRLQYMLSRASTHPLTVRIDTDEARITAGELHSSLAMASNKSSQWQALTIISLPQDEPDAQVDDAITSMKLQPMKLLRHLTVKEPVFTPLLRILLQNVATEAVGNLVSMEIHSPPAIQYLFPQVRVSVYGSLTTFIAKLPKMSHPIDLLPYFMRLEVLDLTNLHLSITDNGSSLPYAHTLRHLRLKAVSIQWMGSQVFSQLEDCTIIAPLTDAILHHDVQLPACTKLHFENWGISPIGQFFAPALDHMRVQSNAWSPYTGNRQVVQLVRAGFGIGIKPKYLSLRVVCKDKVLLAALQLLPGLAELRLDVPRPSALGKRFFTALLAKPGNQGTDELQFDWRELFREHSTGWRCTVCPSLRILELKYQQWLRPGYNDDFLPPLFALSYSREKAATPLQLQVHYKSSMNSLESWNSTLPQVKEAISCLTIPHHGKITHFSLQTRGWNNAVHENALFVPFLHRLQILILSGHWTAERKVLNVLPLCHELRELDLCSISVPPLAHDVDLPFVHTLQKLSLRNSTLAWIGGLVFAQLQRFEVDEHSWPETFNQKVGMPACTHIVFEQYKLKHLPILQSNFHLPSLDTCEFPFVWGHSLYNERGISALQQIHAKVFKFRVANDSLRLLELLESKVEVEQLNLVFGSTTAVKRLLTRFSVANPITGRMPCPNVKVLRIQFGVIPGAYREQISQLCRQVMDTRRLAGHSLEKCYIWWNYRDWEKAAPLVLVVENKVVRTEEYVRS